MESNNKVNHSGACAHIEGILRNLEDGRRKLDDLWATRRLKLDLCLQLRNFERDALEVRKDIQTQTNYMKNVDTICLIPKGCLLMD